MKNDGITEVREAMVQQDRQLAAMFDKLRELDVPIPATFADELEAALEPTPPYPPSFAGMHHALRA